MESGGKGSTFPEKDFRIGAERLAGGGFFLPAVIQASDALQQGHKAAEPRLVVRVGGHVGGPGHATSGLGRGESPERLCPTSRTDQPVQDGVRHENHTAAGQRRRRESPTRRGGRKLCIAGGTSARSSRWRRLQPGDRAAQHAGSVAALGKMSRRAWARHGGRRLIRAVCRLVRSVVADERDSDSRFASTSTLGSSCPAYS